MNEFQATAVMVGLFALRCVAPLALTLFVGYLMNRLVDRWEREDEARKAGAALPAPRPQPKPAIPVVAVKPGLPCWVFNNCDEKKRSGCAAYQNQTVPCWLARMRADGALPAGCPDCAIYRARLAPIPAGR
jgi:hypothetical protein